MPTSRREDLTHAIDVLKHSISRVEGVAESLSSLVGRNVEVLHLENALEEMKISLYMAQQELSRTKV